MMILIIDDGFTERVEQLLRREFGTAATIVTLHDDVAARVGMPLEAHEVAAATRGPRPSPDDLSELLKALGPIDLAPCEGPALFAGVWQRGGTRPRTVPAWGSAVASALQRHQRPRDAPARARAWPAQLRAFCG